MMNAIENTVTQQPDWLCNFIDIYQRLDTNNVALIEKIYHPNITFQDPLHQVSGRTALLEYFQQLYSNLTDCQFEITHVFNDNEQAAIYWNMTFCHRQLNGGKMISVTGHSHIKGQDAQVIYHRDYLDAGSMLYEHIPVLGALVRLIKQRASQ